MNCVYPKSLNQSFYRKHHKLFFSLLNGYFTAWFFRKLLQLKSPLSEKIAFLHPNGYSVHIKGAEFRAELYHYDHVSLRMYKCFGWLFSAFHWFDLSIANRFAPSLNLGFDEYEEPTIDVVVAGSASEGYRNFDYWYDFDEIRSAEGTTAASNNLMIAEILASEWGKYCYLSRGIISYNTSFLTYNDIVSEAALRLYLVNPVNYTSSFEVDNLIITSHEKVTSYVLGSNDITTDDFHIDMFGDVSFCHLSWDDYIIESPNAHMFYLNENGLNYIKRQAHTAFGLMVEMDFRNEEPDPFYVQQGDLTSYTLTVPSTGSTFVFLYYSLDNQIVMNM
jgi:hypothetical protein